MTGKEISLDNKTFKIIKNDGIGVQLTPGSIFYFKQDEDKISADYSGGVVVKGILEGTIKGDKLQHHYEQYDKEGRKFVGNAKADIVIKEDGKIQLIDEWEWESQKGKGSCIMEEV